MLQCIPTTAALATRASSSIHRSAQCVCYTKQRKEVRRSWQEDKVERVVNVAAVANGAELQQRLQHAQRQLIDSVATTAQRICHAQDPEGAQRGADAEQAAKLLRLVQTEGAPGLAFAGKWASLTASLDAESTGGSGEARQQPPQPEALQRPGTKAQFCNSVVQQAVVRRHRLLAGA